MKKLLFAALGLIIAQYVQAQTVTVNNHSNCSYNMSLTGSDASPMCPITTGYVTNPITLPAQKHGVPSTTTVSPSTASWLSSAPTGSIVWDWAIITDPLCGGPQILFGVCTTASSSPGSYDLSTCPGACQPSISYTWSISGGNVTIDIN